MINNFELIKSFLTFEEDKSTFYYLQVLQRKKDNPGMSWQTKQRYFKFVRSLEELEEYVKEATVISNYWNARTYISLTPRSLEKLSLEALVELSSRIKNKDYTSNFRIFEKLALLPECTKKEWKLWMIDYDNLDLSRICEFLGSRGIQIKARIPTPQGYHIVVRPFNLQVLEEPLDTDHNYSIEGFEFGLKFDCNVLLYYKN